MSVAIFDHDMNLQVSVLHAYRVLDATWHVPIWKRDATAEHARYTMIIFLVVEVF